MTDAIPSTYLLNRIQRQYQQSEVQPLSFALFPPPLGPQGIQRIQGIWRVQGPTEGAGVCGSDPRGESCEAEGIQLFLKPVTMPILLEHDWIDESSMGKGGEYWVPARGNTISYFYFQFWRIWSSIYDVISDTNDTSIRMRFIRSFISGINSARKSVEYH